MRAWAAKARDRGDTKSELLLDWVEDIVRPGGEWSDERVIVFTEYRHTQQWLHERFAARGLAGDRLALLYGGMDNDEREGIGWQDAEPGSLEGDLQFLAVAAQKVDAIRDDLTSVGPVIAEQIEEAMTGRRRRLDTGDAERRSPQRRIRKLERDLREDIARLRELDLKPARLERDDDRDYAGLVFEMPQLTGSRALAAVGLEHPVTGKRQPITFSQHVAAGHDDVVLVHLGHRSARRPQGVLRSHHRTTPGPSLAPPSCAGGRLPHRRRALVGHADSLSSWRSSRRSGAVSSSLSTAAVLHARPQPRSGIAERDTGAECLGPANHASEAHVHDVDGRAATSPSSASVNGSSDGGSDGNHTAMRLNRDLLATQFGIYG